MLRENFNHDWMFAREEKPEKLQPITLPHDAMILEERNEHVITGAAGGYYPGGSYLYIKKFKVPKEAVGETWLIEFEGAYLDSFVYLNKCFVTSNHSGYRGFIADLTPYIKYGEENELEVRVKNDAQANSRWYSGSGLYRPVWLYRGGNVHIVADGVRITTPEVEEAVSKVVVSVSIENTLRQTTRVRLNTVIRDIDGMVVCTENNPVTLFPRESPVITQQLYVRGARLWSLENPYLYTCEVQILEDKEILDEAQEHFGIRHIQIDPVKGLRINGQQVLLRGSCIHHDNGILGAATFDDAEERKVMLSKAAGFNALRIAHQSSSKALLEACDKHGVLLMEESFDQWYHSKNSHDFAERFHEEWEREIEAIVLKDYNHPSVFMYSIGNEIMEGGDLDGIRMSRILTNKFRQLDSTRPVTNAVNGTMSLDNMMTKILMEMGVLTPEQITDILQALKDEGADSEASAKKVDINDFMTVLAEHMEKIVRHAKVTERIEEAFSHLDVCGYNYMDGRYEQDMENYPNRVILGSETNPPKIAQLWSYTQKNAACLGDFTWTGWDYIGESGIGITRYNEKKAFGEEYPVYLAYCGDLDITGYRMPISYYREIVFGLRKEPYISVQDPVHFVDEPFNSPWAIPETLESWTWPGQEGNPVKVTIFSVSEEVVLFCNEEEVGRVPCGASHRFCTVIETKYRPGEICAIGYTGGQEDGRFLIQTAKPEIKINAELTKTEITADGSELSFLSIEITDDSGVVHREKNCKVSIKTEGGIKLQGFGSADPYSKENFFDTTRTTYHGRALAAIRGIQTGIGNIEISADDCETVILKISVR